MSVAEARREFEAGRLPAEQLLDLLDRQERLIQHLHAEIDRLQQRLAHYEPEVRSETAPAHPTRRRRPPPAASKPNSVAGTAAARSPRAGGPPN